MITGNDSYVLVYADLGQFGHVVAYVSKGGDAATSASYWTVPGTLED